ncbi:MAG: N-acetyltransferase [Clostridiaceae bacterium]|nr:N-acetyltransferase [Clostridiaceae bacterium]
MHEIKKGNQRFYIGEAEDKAIAEITWVPSRENVIIVDHTYVSDELGGQGVGKKLVDRVARMAEEEELKIIATCPFAQKVIARSEHYQNLLLDLEV